jgi:hypothetical protein
MGRRCCDRPLGAIVKTTRDACWPFLTDRGLDFLVVGEPMSDNCISVPTIAVVASTRRRSLLRPQTIHEDALPLGKTGHR